MALRLSLDRVFELVLVHLDRLVLAALESIPDPDWLHIVRQRDRQTDKQIMLSIPCTYVPYCRLHHCVGDCTRSAPTTGTWCV